MNLYELSSRFQHLLELDDLDQAACEELQSLHETIEDEFISYGKYIRNRQAELDAVTAARKEMQEREKSLTAKIERNEQRLAERMKACSIERVTKSPLFPLRVKQNPVSVDDFDKTAIPENYWRTKVTETKAVDKDAVKKAIEAGNDVPGCRLVSKLRIEFK